VDAFVARGYNVHILDNESTGSVANRNPMASYARADVRDYASIAPFFDGVEIVCHLAACPRVQPSFENPIAFLDVNVAGTINILRAARAAGVRRTVYSSSSAVYGDSPTLPTKETDGIRPSSPYAIQKYEGELYARLWAEVHDLSIVALRYFNVFGPRSWNPQDPFNAYSSPAMIFAKQRKAGLPLTITWDGEQRRDYIFVGDVALANHAAALVELPNLFDIVNIGSGENHTVNEIANLIGGERTYLPKRDGEVRVTLCDNLKAQNLLGWAPRTLFTEGVRACMQDAQLL
jgi:UDP-glucose 4-epimerase